MVVSPVPTVDWREGPIARKPCLTDMGMATAVMATDMAAMDVGTVTSLDATGLR
jgi:hypothetical protein